MERARNPYLAGQHEALHQEMLLAWHNKSLSAGEEQRGIDSHISVVKNFVAFSGKYVWEWSRGDAEAYGAYLRQHYKKRTVRDYQEALRRFVAFLLEDGRDWQQRCTTLAGVGIAQVFLANNTVPHVGSEMDPTRRPFTGDELRAMTAYFTTRIAQLQASQRKGLLTTARDYTIFVLALMYGVRDDESAHIEDFDFSSSPDTRSNQAYGAFAVLTIRYGKAKRRGSKRRRQVLSVPEFAFLLPTLQWYLHHVRPHFPSAPGCEHRLFVTERGGALETSNIAMAFRTHRSRAGLSKTLSLHSLRHTYITRLLEWGYPELFVQAQVGHEDASSTASYTTIGDSFRQQCIREALERVLS